MICYSSDLEVSCSRNYNIMRPLHFRPDELRALLLHNKIATLDELKQALGTPVDVTIFHDVLAVEADCAGPCLLSISIHFSPFFA